jgi:soluble lytic murein transglycosylase
LARELKGRHSLAEVYWLRGRMMEEKQKFGGAAWWFEQALKQKFYDQEFKEKVQWYLAWNYRKLKRYDDAVSQLQQLKDKTENPYAKAKFWFWLAKSLKQTKKAKVALASFQGLAQEDPIGYYGLLAHNELGERLKHPSAYIKDEKKEKNKSEENLGTTSEDLGSPLSDDLTKLLDPLYIKWLISVEEKGVAKYYLDFISSGYRKQKADSQHAWLTLLNYYARAGIYLDLFTQLGQLPPKQRRSLLEIQPELLFPTPYREYVDTASNTFSVSPEFLYAIMRQESAFNPMARSHADAFGLMQLLPEIAERTAPDLGLPYSKADDLFEPNINITLGSHFLSSLWKKYQGRFILATAAYNANDRAIRGWLKTRYRGDSLEFIEDIPYEETQGYVKLVLRNMIFYKILNSKGEPIEFPNWALELGAPDA